MTKEAPLQSSEITGTLITSTLTGSSCLSSSADSQQAGFRQIRVTDTTENAARIAKQWHHAREKRKEEPAAAEGNINFEGLQRFLSCIHTLTGEKRLLRNLYSASKELRGDLIQRLWKRIVSEVLDDAPTLKCRSRSAHLRAYGFDKREVIRFLPGAQSRSELLGRWTPPPRLTIMKTGVSVSY
jgi:hypothetical protein